MFHGKRVEVHFLRVKFRKDKDGNKQMAADFAIPKVLPESDVPLFLQEAIKGMLSARCISTADLTERITRQNATFYMLPNAATEEFAFKGVELTDLTLDRSDGFLFTIDAPYGDSLAHSAIDNFGNKMWVVLEDQQQQLNITITPNPKKASVN